MWINNKKSVNIARLHSIFFSIFMGCQNGNENVFHGFGNLVILHWKDFGNMLRVVYLNPVLRYLRS